MIFKGFLLFIDPLKEDIKDVIEQMNTLGVSLKMITGTIKKLPKILEDKLALIQTKFSLAKI